MTFEGGKMAPIADQMIYALKRVIEILEAFSIFQRVKSELINQPEIATKYFALILKEMNDMYQIFNEEITTFLNLNFETEEDRRHTKKYLTRLQGNELRLKLNEGKFHCSRIEHIYRQYLDGWFSRRLNSSDYYEIERICRRFFDHDVFFYDRVGNISHTMSYYASILLDYMNNCQYDPAQSTINSLSKEWLEPRFLLKEKLDMIWHLYIEFAKVTKTIDIEIK